MRWNVDPEAGPIFEQIANAVMAALARGELEPGDKLPSARALAEELRVNPNTVIRAFELLEQLEGPDHGVGVDPELLGEGPRRGELVPGLELAPGQRRHHGVRDLLEDRSRLGVHVPAQRYLLSAL